MRARTNSSSPRARCSAQIEALRRHCQTSAGATGRSESRSNTTTVSRWLVMPTATGAGSPAASMAVLAAASTDCHSCSGSCSTQPSRG